MNKKKLSVYIVVANYYKNITDSLTSAAVDHLKKNNIETLTSLLLFNLKKTFDLFLPSKFLLLCFKNDFISNK